MAIVVYKCSVCDREIELVENAKGLEAVGRCVITDGCRGKLFQLNRKIDYVRGKYPKAVTGLSDWTQRKVLYNHIQSTPVYQWHVEHGMGVNPSVQVFGERPDGSDTVLTEIEPDSIEIVNENNLILHFSRTEAGRAQCIGRASQPVVDITRVEEQAVVEVQPFQLSGNSEVTIATLSSELNIDLVISFITPDQRVVDLTYTVDSAPAITSPWSDVDTAYFHGRVYTIRSFNFINQTELTDGTIPESSSFYIKQIDVGSGVRDMNEEEVILLLANSPYTVYDKLTDQFIDPTILGSEDAAFSFYFDNGEAFAYDNLIENVFPHIRKL